MKKTLEEYLRLSYPIELVRDPDARGYFARHPDLDGCMAQGATVQAAVENLDAARELWIETRLEDGLPVPEPRLIEPSGRLLLRMAPWLHAKLMDLAQRQAVSLNQFIITVLAEFVGGARYLTDVERLHEIVGRLETVITQQEVMAPGYSYQITGCSLAPSKLATNLVLADPNESSWITFPSAWNAFTIPGWSAAVVAPDEQDKPPVSDQASSRPSVSGRVVPMPIRAAGGRRS
jgi:predicted RNase H-like HicB family nuclease